MWTRPHRNPTVRPTRAALPAAPANSSAPPLLLSSSLFSAATLRQRLTIPQNAARPTFPPSRSRAAINLNPGSRRPHLPGPLLHGHPSSPPGATAPPRRKGHWGELLQKGRCHHTGGNPPWMASQKRPSAPPWTALVGLPEIDLRGRHGRETLPPPAPRCVETSPAYAANLDRTRRRTTGAWCQRGRHDVRGERNSHPGGEEAEDVQGQWAGGAFTAVIVTGLVILCNAGGGPLPGNLPKHPARRACCRQRVQGSFPPEERAGPKSDPGRDHQFHSTSWCVAVVISNLPQTTVADAPERSPFAWPDARLPFPP